MEITITLTQAEILYIGSILQEKPYKDVYVLLHKIQEQIDNQQEKEKPKLEAV